MGVAGSLGSCVAGNMFIRDGFFDMDALTIKRLMLSIYITLRKANCQALTQKVMKGKGRVVTEFDGCFKRATGLGKTTGPCPDLR